MLPEISPVGGKEVPFTVVDWGSNFGWFSVLLSEAFPSSLVWSVEGGLQADASLSAGVSFHEQYLLQNEIDNNRICAANFSGKTFHHLQEEDITFDYQLLFSVVHWVFKWQEYSPSRQSWERNVCTWLRAAKTTFVEMVNPRGPVSQGPDRNHPVFVWYDGRIEEGLILEETLLACALQGTVRRLERSVGKIPRKLLVLKGEEERLMFRVDLQAHATPVERMRNLSGYGTLARCLGCILLNHSIDAEGNAVTNSLTYLEQDTGMLTEFLDCNDSELVDRLSTGSRV